MKLLYFLPFIGFLLSCSDNKVNFQVSGSVDGARGKTLYLASAGSIDSITVDSEDNFEFNGQVNGGNFYNLYFDKINPILLYVDSGAIIQIKSGFENFSGNYSIIGSDVSNDIKTLQQKLNETFSIVKGIYDEKIKVADSTNIDSVKNAIATETNKVVENHRHFIFDFIKRNPSSFAVLPAIYQSFDSHNPIFNFVNDYEYYTMIDSAMMKTWPKSVHAQDFHSQYLQMKRQFEPYLKQQNQPSENKTAPDFTVSTPEGKSISLSSFKGKYVLLDFWAAWCAPCRQENPNLVNAFRIYSKKNFTIFQVSLDKNKEDWTNAIQKDQLNKWYHGSDLKYWDSQPAQIYGINSIPSNFLINPDGIIIARDLRGEDLINKLKEVL